MNSTSLIPSNACRRVAILLLSTASGTATISAANAQEGHASKINRDATYEAIAQQRSERLAKQSPVTDDMLRSPPTGDWLSWRRGHDSTGFSPLSQISTSNVGKLASTWSWSLQPSLNEITPLVHEGTLYLASADRVQALDGRNGDLLWQYVRPLPEGLLNGRNAIVKNIAIYAHHVYWPTPDGHMVALDSRTGSVVWDQQVLDAAATAAHVGMVGGPLVAQGVVMQGTTRCFTYRGGCFIVGLDAFTGRERWRLHTIARPGEPGGDTWNGTPLDQRYGGAVWTSGSYDGKSGLAYFGVGQTYDTATLLRRKTPVTGSVDALYTDSTLAIEPATGRLAWHYQHFKRDVWDFDWAFEQVLIDLPVGGHHRQLVVTGGKIAIFDAIDRVDGSYLFSRDLGLQNIVIAIDPVTGNKTIDPALDSEAHKTKEICPHSGGARSWPATAYDPTRQLLFVPLVEACMDFTWKPGDEARTTEGGVDIEWVLKPRNDTDGKFGRLQAINLRTGKVAWVQRRRAPQSSSVLATAGGLVFEGSRDRVFRASDASTGKVLWETRLNAVPSSSPVSYGVDGVQYVAVVAGGGGGHDLTWPALTPEIEDSAVGTTLWVFKLPSRLKARR